MSLREIIFFDFDTVVLDYDYGLNQLASFEKQFYINEYHIDVVSISKPKLGIIEVIEKLRPRYEIRFLVKKYGYYFQFMKKFFPDIQIDLIPRYYPDRKLYLIDTNIIETFIGTLFYIGNKYCKSTEKIHVIYINNITDILDYLT